MKVFRWLAAGLVWIGAGLLGVVGGLLCVTILLLPLGIPLLMAARRLFSVSTKLMMPSAVRHPAKESGKALKGSGKDVGKSLKSGKKNIGRSKTMKNMWKSVPDAVTPKSERSFLHRVGLRR